MYVQRIPENFQIYEILDRKLKVKLIVLISVKIIGKINFISMLLANQQIFIIFRTTLPKTPTFQFTFLSLKVHIVQAKKCPLFHFISVSSVKYDFVSHSQKQCVMPCSDYKVHDSSSSEKSPRICSKSYFICSCRSVFESSSG